MIPALRLPEIGDHLFVDREGAARERLQEAAATDDRREAGRVRALSGEAPPHLREAKLELIGEGPLRERGELGFVVLRVLLEKRTVFFEEAELGGRRSGVQGENAGGTSFIHE
jgi:hypothetical protein